MKIIVVKWVKENSIYKKAMNIITSNHPRFTVGDRFDFGFMSIVTDEEYIVISLPMSLEAGEQPGDKQNKPED